MNFDYFNVEYFMTNPSEGLTIKGDISNKSTQTFNSVVFRAIVFARNTPLGSTTFTVHGFSAGQTRSFSTYIMELQSEKEVSTVTRCEIIVQNAY